MIRYADVVEDWELNEGGGPDFADVPFPGCVLKPDGVWVQIPAGVYLTAKERVTLCYHPTGDYSKPALPLPCTQDEWDRFIEHMCDSTIPLEPVPEALPDPLPPEPRTAAAIERESVLETCEPRERLKADALSIELDDLFSQMHARGERITAGRVRKVLKDRAGKSNSCIKADTAGGIKWERDNGSEEELTIRALEGRIARWKEMQNPTITTRQAR